MSYIPGLRDATWYNYAIKRKVISESIALIYFIYFFTFLTNLTTGEQVIKRVFQLKYEYKSNKMYIVKQLNELNTMQVKINT